MGRITHGMSYQDCARSRALTALDAVRDLYEKAGLREHVDHDRKETLPVALSSLVNDLRYVAEAQGISWDYILQTAETLHLKEKVEEPETLSG
jgi:hypothetical protein